MSLEKILIFVFGCFIGFFFTKLYSFLTPKQRKLIKDKFNNVADSVEGKK